MNPLYNEILKTSLLDTYFPDSSKNLNDGKFYEYENNIEQQILHESREEYQKIIQELGRSLDDNQFEEEQFIRSGKFKRIVPLIYDNTCSVSGHKLDSTINIQMIDACHIIPFSESYNDTITNGIALSPSIHRAFDRMLITINADYIIRVSPTVTETESPFSLQQFDGKQILLPEKSEYHPSIESLSWHNSRFVL
jgi:putative restriction endonuclease